MTTGAYTTALAGCLAAAAVAVPARVRAQDRSDAHTRNAPWIDLRVGFGVQRELCDPGRNQSCPAGAAAGYSLAAAAGVAPSRGLLVGAELRRWTQLGWFEEDPFTPDRATYLMATAQATSRELPVLSFKAAAGAVRHRQGGHAEVRTNPAAGAGLVLANPPWWPFSMTLHADYLRAFGGPAPRPRLVEVGLGMRWR